jgi:Cys-tRNA(Pro)/Cys-tRNA(Cys) deacylase
VKKVELAALKDVEPLTGYVRGGVTVMAARTAFPAFADETIELHDVISVSAGQRGTQLVLAPADYLRATGANARRPHQATHAGHPAQRCGA